MICRYLGNKQSILDRLMGVVGAHCALGDHVVDIFSGSLSVSLALKRAGYRVTSNDINLLSAIIGEAYLTPTAPPAVKLTDLARGRTRELRGWAKDQLPELDLPTDFVADDERRTAYVDLLAVIHHLATLGPDDVPKGYLRNDFFDTYCESGRRSAFVSSRGSSGRRRFFSPDNARRIDLILSTVRAWRREGRIDRAAEAVLLSVLMRAVEMVSNTQGTYHDFPRSEWDSRALKPLRMQAPPADFWLPGVDGHRVGREEDSLEFIGTVGPHRLLYIDPPYNFRQYTAYYFLLNVLCRYPELDDLDGYFAGVTYVRGQNPDDDFSSTFCKAAAFIEALGGLIRDAEAEYVVISYFTGRNHWSQFDVGPSDTGKHLISELLSGTMFEPGSLSVVEVPRTNYASYGGFKARTVNELLLVARKRDVSASGSSDDSGEWLPTVA